MKSRLILLVGGLALLIGPSAALTQMRGQRGQGGGGNGAGLPQGGGAPQGAAPGGFQRGGLQGGGGMGGGGAGGMMNQDPNERWNQMTGGKDVWVRTEITDQRQQFFFDMMARQLNVTNGQLTKQQFFDFSEQMRQRFQAGGFNRGGGGMGGGAPGGAPGGTGAGAAPGGPGGGFNPDAFAEVMFKRYDKNGDGLLNNDEMPENLKAEREKWDKNGDGMIDLAEFKEYMKGRVDQIRAENPGMGGPGGGGGTGVIPILPNTPTPEEEEPKRVVYRAGKLPKELPPWFAQYDKDSDGQIGLYEWKTSGQPLETFFAMDRNGDGFVTVEEVLRYEADRKPKNANGVATANNSPSTPGGSPGAAPGGSGQFPVGAPGQFAPGGTGQIPPGGPGQFTPRGRGQFPANPGQFQPSGRGQSKQGDGQPREGGNSRRNRQGGGGPG